MADENHITTEDVVNTAIPPFQPPPKQPSNYSQPSYTFDDTPPLERMILRASGLSSQLKLLCNELDRLDHPLSWLYSDAVYAFTYTLEDIGKDGELVRGIMLKYKCDEVIHP